MPSPKPLSVPFPRPGQVTRRLPAPFMAPCTALVMAMVAVLVLSSCSTAAREGAERGAKRGAIGGLVAGAVGSIFWGGDAVNNALRTAAVGAATGATMGALDGSERDRRQGGAPANRTGQTGQAGSGPAEDAALRAWVGDANYAAGEELARCRHASAIARAERAFVSETDRDRQGFALLIQAMAAEESGNSAKASQVYQRWATFDPARADRDKARADALAGILRIQRIRQQQGLPVLCP